MYSFINTVNAANNTSTLFDAKMWAWDFVSLTIAIFVLVAWIFSIIFALWWSLLLVLSWWKDDKIKPALNTIRYAVIWVAITVLVIFVFPILWRLLWLDVEKYAKPEVIFKRIEDLWNKVFWKSWTIAPSSSSSEDLQKFPEDFSDL